MTEPLTDQQYDEIDARAAHLYEYATGLDDEAQAEADQLTGTDVPALLADNRRLRAAADAFRAEFGDLVVKGRDGDWANVADWIATGARIPACGAFYPHHTDTRCTRAKGHRGSHNAPWGTRDMAWPYDPRETIQPPLTAEELATAPADVDALKAEFPDEPADGHPAAVPAVVPAANEDGNQ